MPTSQTWYYM
ncbi:hypothetical protein F383_24447 [Gossypium arboreum]|uniref:Uncharacterized protein n=1 Tax=Gossypium arboreum TaxID=29729 RepID=A0A0B0P6A4_GOSAR|nr:hypothetical protein F383_24447 [Gossypium arboreum]